MMHSSEQTCCKGRVIDYFPGADIRGEDIESTLIGTRTTL